MTIVPVSVEEEVTPPFTEIYLATASDSDICTFPDTLTSPNAESLEAMPIKLALLCPIDLTDVQVNPSEE